MLIYTAQPPLGGIKPRRELLSLTQQRREPRPEHSPGMESRDGGRQAGHGHRCWHGCGTGLGSGCRRAPRSLRALFRCQWEGGRRQRRARFKNRSNPLLRSHFIRAAQAAGLVTPLQAPREVLPDELQKRGEETKTKQTCFPTEKKKLLGRSLSVLKPLTPSPAQIPVPSPHFPTNTSQASPGALVPALQQGLNLSHEHEILARPKSAPLPNVVTPVPPPGHVPGTASPPPQKPPRTGPRHRVKLHWATVLESTAKR